MDKLKANDFQIKSSIICSPIYQDQCWYDVYYNGNYLPLRRCPTKSDARRYISEVVQYGNFFLVENPEAYSELTIKINEAKEHFGGNLSGNNVPPAIREAVRVKELLDPLKEATESRQKSAVKKETPDRERE